MVFVYKSIIMSSHHACRMLGLDHHVLKSTYIEDGDSSGFRFPRNKSDLYRERLHYLKQAYAVRERRGKSENTTCKCKRTEDENPESVGSRSGT